MNNIHIACLYLRERVFTHVDVLGMIWRGGIGSIKCSYHLPQSSAGYIEKLLQPKVIDSHCAVNSECYGNRDGEASIDWGIGNSKESATVYAIAVEFLSNCKSYDDARKTLEVPLRNWARLFSDWLSVLADGLTNFYLPLYGDVYWMNAEWGLKSLYTEYRAGNVYEPNMIHANDWEYAMIKSTNGQEAPVARVLLYQAELAIATGHSNQAILHCATATELALAKGLRLRLEELGSNIDVIECVLKRSKMLGERVRITKELGMKIPKSLMKNLVDPRNNVVHRGKRIEIEQAERAIRTARIVVDEFDPLDDHDPVLQPIK